MGPHFYNKARRGWAEPFLVARQGRAQDRLLVGPAILAEAQTRLVDWLYCELDRDVDSVPSAFRMGVFDGVTVVARTHRVDVVEDISSRRDGLVTIGLAGAGFSVGQLSTLLGGILPALCTDLEGEHFPGPWNEGAAFRRLALKVAERNDEFDWRPLALSARQKVGPKHNRARTLSAISEAIYKTMKKRGALGLLTFRTPSLEERFHVGKFVYKRTRSRSVTIADMPGVHDGAPEWMFCSIEKSGRSTIVFHGIRIVRLGKLEGQLVEILQDADEE